MGRHYEIDISDKNAAALPDALVDYVGAARRPSGGTRTRTTTANARVGIDGEQNQAIRDWAREQGMNVSPEFYHLVRTFGPGDDREGLAELVSDRDFGTEQRGWPRRPRQSGSGGRTSRGPP